MNDYEKMLFFLIYLILFLGKCIFILVYECVFLFVKIVESYVCQ